MNDWVQGVLAQLAFMDLVKTGVLDGSELHLYKSDTVITRDTVKADLTECDFDGYAAITLTTWNNPYVNAAGQCVCLAGEKQFDTATPWTTGNNVYGWWIEESGGDLILAGRFSDAPRPMAAPGDACLVDAGWNFGYSGPS